MKKQKKAFSIIVAIFMTGFLMILTIGVLNLVLREMKDNKGNENYLKAYSSAEGAMELALLKIKENSYSYDEDLNTTNSGAESLSFNQNFNKNKDPKISYKMEIKTNRLDGIIGTGSKSTIIIPLFWQDGTSNGKTTQLKLSNIELENGSSSKEDIIWNILGNKEGISGTGIFDESTTKKIKLNDGTFQDSSIESFLEREDLNYLILFNKNSSEKIKYKLESGKIINSTYSEEFFSNPNGSITSSVVVGKYKQNITTNIDNTEFLKMLKYSLYNQ